MVGLGFSASDVLRNKGDSVPQRGNKVSSLLGAIVVLLGLPFVLRADEPKVPFDLTTFDAATVKLVTGGYVGAHVDTVSYSLTKRAVTTLVRPKLEKAMRDYRPARWEVEGTLRLYNTKNPKESITFVVYAKFTRVSIDRKYYVVDLSSIRRLIVSQNREIASWYRNTSAEKAANKSPKEKRNRRVSQNGARGENESPKNDE